MDTLNTYVSDPESDYSEKASEMSLTKSQEIDANCEQVNMDLSENSSDNDNSSSHDERSYERRKSLHSSSYRSSSSEKDNDYSSSSSDKRSDNRRGPNKRRSEDSRSSNHKNGSHRSSVSSAMSDPNDCSPDRKKMRQSADGHKSKHTTEDGRYNSKQKVDESRTSERDSRKDRSSKASTDDMDYKRDTDKNHRRDTDRNRRKYDDSDCKKDDTDRRRDGKERKREDRHYRKDVENKHRDDRHRSERVSEKDNSRHRYYSSRSDKNYSRRSRSRSHHRSSRSKRRSRSRSSSYRHRHSDDRKHYKRRSPYRSSRRSRSRSHSKRRSPYARPFDRKSNNKLQVLEKLGIELKIPAATSAGGASLLNPDMLKLNGATQLTPQLLLQKQMEEQVEKVKSATGIALPSYYNPIAVNPSKYAEQMQKRRLLWQNKDKQKTETEEAPAPVIASPIQPPTTTTADGKGTIWQGATFGGDQDGKMTAKFKRLMGIKEDQSVAAVPEGGSDIIKKQEEMFSSMESQYEVARLATHSHRGLGLGFGTFQPR